MTAIARIAAFVVCVTALCVVMGCNAARTTPGKATPAASADPLTALRGKLFLLRDARDMRLAVLKLVKEGQQEDALLKRARHLTFADFETFIRSRSDAAQINYQGGGRFRYDARNLLLAEEVVSEIVFRLRLTQVDVDGRALEAIVLEGVDVRGHDIMPYAGYKVYRDILALAMK
ncbi:regulator of RNase E activity RraB [Desulfobaculum xiamenense]|uniref:Regulator of RNase E activity RraB n=1 Tax=Desulfobaculum xiamenense TaxID=995050 RepID=A0A846QEL6_9BACT|nr:hypothetical protein [Desulfobaculum xiamenense]NJB67196.1 regulator of RNase E activity RraB [Desulfobaculum xiamenense]